MSTEDNGFNTLLDTYLDDEVSLPPKVKHTAACVASEGIEYTKQKFYTLPISCIRRGCTITTWDMSHDKSHLKLHSGISLQHALQDLITQNAITPQNFYEIIEFHREAVYESLTAVKQLQFSQRRRSPIKVKGKIINYKNEDEKWIFYIRASHITMGKLTLPSSSIKIVAISA
ncbi:Transcription initiation factor IIA [Babesia duncani]|uniref:Transcription initiation factor IIA n=1 Tax=Babesia duncani TaxID=323732 RepID=A0AAD9PL28_9APIC|nr:Transcription initiation factor IIA [Babesia duncani]